MLDLSPKDVKMDENSSQEKNQQSNFNKIGRTQGQREGHLES